MTVTPIAHVGGMPVEETLVSLGPVLMLFAGLASARVSALLRTRQRR